MAQPQPLNRQAPSGPVTSSLPAVQGLSGAPNANGPSAQTNLGTFVSEDGAAVSFTIPLDSALALPIGHKGKLVQGGNATITVVGGVTIQSLGSLVASAGEGAVIFYEKIGVDRWSLTGDLA